MWRLVPWQSVLGRTPPRTSVLSAPPPGRKTAQNSLDPELSGITEEKAVFHRRKPKSQRGVSTEQAFRCGEKAFQPGEITSVPGIVLSGGFPAEGGLRLGSGEQGSDLDLISQEGSPLKGD